MLNYAFPYDSADIGKAYSAMAHSLHDAITCNATDQPKYLKFFLSTFERFRLLLPNEDFRYFAFQCWQEGVARYTELKVAESAGSGYSPGSAFQSLKDFKPFREVADSIRSTILGQLANPSLGEMKRVAFYSFGAGEALLLDKVHPGWKKQYLQDKFHLEKYFSK